MIAIAIQLLLVAFGAAIGLSVLAVSPESGTAKGVGIGGGIWWVIATLVSLFCGGFVAARLSGTARNTDGMLHGAVTWGVFTLAGVLMLGTLIGGAWSVLSTAAPYGQSVGVNPAPANTDASANRDEASRNITAAAQKATGPTTGAAWGLFAMLLLGLGAAIAGGASGVKAVRREGAIRSDTEHPGLGSPAVT